ncbi:MAG: hypothetical protein IIT72_00880 [Lachnospiraceae bacterium]|nr:hypothetical protein [Lachnospiraceae bacterium]
MRGSIRQRHAKTRQVISVLGVTEGAGATRLALSIANYYASAEGRKTAYGEISKETKLGYILEKAKCIATEPVGFQDPFLLYYPALGRQ